MARGKAGWLPKGNPMMLVLLLVTGLPAAGISFVLGAGAAAVIAAMVGLFSLISFMGGPLRHDLRIVGWLAPILLAGATLPHLLAALSAWAGIAAEVVVIFGAALLPLWGRRFGSASMGLGMASLFAYGFAEAGAYAPGHVVIAVLCGIVMAVIIRILFGIRDPSKQTRDTLARVLEEQAFPPEAFETWARDGHPEWLHRVLVAGSRYRLTMDMLRAAGQGDSPEARALNARAGDLARAIRAREAADLTPAERTGTTGLAARAFRALDEIAVANASRDNRPHPLDPQTVRAFRRTLARPGEWQSSSQIRHALRSALAVGAMLIGTLSLPPGDTLRVTGLLAMYAVLQVSWHATLQKAWERIIGLCAGAVLVYLLTVTVPSQALMPIGLGAMLLGLFFVRTAPALGYTFMVVLSVSMYSVRGHSPLHSLEEYAVLTLAVAVIGVLVSYVIVPGVRLPALPLRIEEARVRTADLLRTLAAGASMRDPATWALHGRTRRAMRALDPVRRDDLSEDQAAEVEGLRAAFRGLVALAVELSRGDAAGLPCLAAAADVLDGDGAGDGDRAARAAMAEEAGETGPLSSLAMELAERIRDGSGRL